MAKHRTAEVAVRDEGWSHYCAACEGPMRIINAMPQQRTPNAAPLYQCEYMCDCGYREYFEEAL
jgi:hypothetical protein